MTEPQTPEPIWGAHDLPPGASRQWRLGPLRVFCRRTDEELWIAHAYGDESELAPAVEEPPGLTWSRWAHSAPVETIQFVPGFPDRPVVVKPESPFRMTPGAAARIYVRAPLWLRAFLGGLRLRPLAEIPAIKLSNTWFGDFTQGELCYWLSSGARREIEPDPSRPYLAICPIWLVNASESDLNVE
ncbi:MAG: hypothetical protein NTW86_32800, partial [Candidatus Sumerlaeota bacterium]|nr:hypothetical protein [Candidatus Sumerlaeota bacterium]